MAQHTHHITPFKVYRNVLFILLGLTVLTVVFAPPVSGLHLGMLSAIIAIVIASTKAFVVCAYFMGLKYDEKLYVAIIITGVLFLALLFGVCFVDIYTRIIQADPI